MDIQTIHSADKGTPTTKKTPNSQEERNKVNHSYAGRGALEKNVISKKSRIEKENLRNHREWIRSDMTLIHLSLDDLSRKPTWAQYHFAREKAHLNRKNYSSLNFRYNLGNMKGLSSFAIRVLNEL